MFGDMEITSREDRLNYINDNLIALGIEGMVESINDMNKRQTNATIGALETDLIAKNTPDTKNKPWRK